jgi:hypothetical protein
VHGPLVIVGSERSSSGLVDHTCTDGGEVCEYASSWPNAPSPSTMLPRALKVTAVETWELTRSCSPAGVDEGTGNYLAHWFID